MPIEDLRRALAEAKAARREGERVKARAVAHSPEAYGVGDRRRVRSPRSPGQSIFDPQPYSARAGENVAPLSTPSRTQRREAATREAEGLVERAERAIAARQRTFENRRRRSAWSEPDTECSHQASDHTQLDEEQPCTVPEGTGEAPQSPAPLLSGRHTARPADPVSCSSPSAWEQLQTVSTLNDRLEQDIKAVSNSIYQEPTPRKHQREPVSADERLMLQYEQQQRHLDEQQTVLDEDSAEKEWHWRGENTFHPMTTEEIAAGLRYANGKNTVIERAQNYCRKRAGLPPTVTVTDLVLDGLIEGEEKAGGITAAQARRLRERPSGEERLLAVFNMMQATNFMRRNAPSSSQQRNVTTSTQASQVKHPRQKTPARRDTSPLSPETTVLLEAGISLEEIESLKKRGILGPPSLFAMNGSSSCRGNASRSHGTAAEFKSFLQRTEAWNKKVEEKKEKKRAAADVASRASSGKAAKAVVDSCTERMLQWGDKQLQKRAEKMHAKAMEEESGPRKGPNLGGRGHSAPRKVHAGDLARRQQEWLERREQKLHAQREKRYRPPPPPKRKLPRRKHTAVEASDSTPAPPAEISVLNSQVVLRELVPGKLGASPTGMQETHLHEPVATSEVESQAEAAPEPEEQSPEPSESEPGTVSDIRDLNPNKTGVQQPAHVPSPQVIALTKSTVAWLSRAADLLREETTA